MQIYHTAIGIVHLLTFSELNNQVGASIIYQNIPIPFLLSQALTTLIAFSYITAMIKCFLMVLLFYKYQKIESEDIL